MIIPATPYWEGSTLGGLGVDHWQACGPTMDAMHTIGYSYARWGESSNEARFYPFYVMSPTRFDRVLVFPSATGGNSYDVGIYNGVTLARIASSGSVLAANGNATQTITFSSVAFCPRGFYYFAWVASLDSVALTQLQTDAGAAQDVEYIGIRTMTSALPLPATATLATPTNSRIPFWILLEEGSFF